MCETGPNAAIRGDAVVQFTLGHKKLPCFGSPPVKVKKKKKSFTSKRKCIDEEAAG